MIQRLFANSAVVWWITKPQSEQRHLRRVVRKLKTGKGNLRMKKLFVFACCVSMLSGAAVASAQASSPQVQHSIKSSDTTDISARKKMKRMKKSMMRGTTEKSKMGGEPPSGSSGSKKSM